MKNYQLSSIILFLFSLIILGCGSESAKQNSEQAETKTEENSELTPKVEEKNSPWELAKVVDEFGDEVKGESAAIGIFEGKMTNSATADAKVTVKMQVGNDKKTTFITFYEYGNSPGHLPDRKLFNIKIKKEDGSTEFIEQFSMNNMLADTKGVLLGKIMEQSEPLKINVDLSRANQYDKTVYNFEIDPAGLSEILNQIETTEE